MLSQIRSQFNENMGNPYLFDINLINVVGWGTFRLSKLTMATT